MTKFNRFVRLRAIVKLCRNIGVLHRIIITLLWVDTHMQGYSDSSLHMCIIIYPGMMMSKHHIRHHHAAEDEIGLMRFGCGSIPSENELIGVSPTISSAAW